MRRSMWLTLVTLCVASADVIAQDGLRSPVLPEQGPVSAVTTGRDLFLVAPEYYREQLDPPSRIMWTFLPWFAGSVPWPFASSPPAALDPFHPPFHPPHTMRDAPTRTTRDLSVQPALSSTVAPAPLPAGPPKTFYVVPGCYAGDRPPLREWLPAGCDLSALRVIPPR